MTRPDDAARLRAIIECQREIMACGPDRDRVMRLITERTQELTGASSSFIELHEGDHMVYRAVAGAASASAGTRILVSASLSGRCVLEGQTLYCRDTELEATIDLATCRRLQLRSMVVVPLRRGNIVIGVLKVASPQVSGFDDEHIATLELMTGFLSAALAHASEHEAAQRSIEVFESAFGHASVGMALVGLDGRFQRVNDVLCQIVGYPRPDLLKADFQRITHPDDLSGDLQLLGRLLRGEIASYTLDKRYIHKLGHIVYVCLSVSMVRDNAGEPAFFVGQIQDITRARLAESEVQAFFGMSPNLLAIISEGARFERVNPAWTRLLGWTQEELTSRPFLDFVHPDDVELTMSRAERVDDDRTNPEFRYRTQGFRNRYRTQDGSYRWLEWDTRSSGGRTFCDARDVTDQHAREEREVAQARALAESEVRFRALSEGSIQGIVVAALNGERLLYVNEAAAKMFGFGRGDDMRERATLFSLMPHHSRRLLADDWNNFVAGKRDSLRKRIELQRIDGKSLWVDLVGSVIAWDGSRALQMTMIDASAQVALEQALSKQATTDALTGLGNRRHFEKQLSDALNTCERDGGPLSLMMLDLDHFKAVNDRHGHAGGDEALRAFASLLESTLHGRAITARWGGEEFVVLLPRIGLVGALQAAEQIRTHWLEREIRSEGESFFATVSIGVSERRSNERGFNELLERADRALYEAKRGGRNTVRASGAGFETGALPTITTSRA